jgi:hypothetical protein
MSDTDTLPADGVAVAAAADPAPAHATPPAPVVPLHTIQGIVTPDGFELGVHRMRVPGGWLYWLAPMNGAYISSFVPDAAP